jgi:hypothetical protein
MIKISNDEVKQKIMCAKLIFLRLFPLHEIDNKDIQLICQSYRNGNSSLIGCLVYMDKFNEYLYDWYIGNSACNIFYGSK